MHTGAGEWIWRPLRNPHRKTRLVLHRQQPARLRPDAARPASRTTGPGGLLPPAARLLGRAARRLGRGPRRAGRDPDRRTRPTTTSSPTGSRSRPTSRARRSTSATACAPSRRRPTCIPGGKVVNTFQAPARASGSAEPGDATTRRFIIDFAGGDSDYLPGRPAPVQIVPSRLGGPDHAHLPRAERADEGFRAAIDVKLEPGQSTDLRAFLHAGDRALTETWTFPGRRRDAARVRAGAVTRSTGPSRRLLLAIERPCSRPIGSTGALFPAMPSASPTI